MSSTSEPPPQATTEPHGTRHQTVHERRDEDTKDVANDTDEKTSFSARHSDILRHMFPRPSSRNAPLNKTPDGPIPESKRRKVLSSLPRQSKPRVAFHKVLTSFFSHPIGNPESQKDSSQGSSASSTSTPSKGGSAIHSAPSLEVVSPGTFLFSGPSLRSALSGSLTNSTSHLPSLTGNGSECYSFRCTESGSLSLDNLSLVEDEILEPFVECGITRSMSDVMRGLSTPFDEIEGPILEERNEDEYSLADGTMGRCDFDCTHSIAGVASFLVPFLDAASWKALRLTCRSWHSAFTLAAPPKFPPSYNVPTEILQHVYDYLGPLDFNSCRRVCRDWMRASLNKTLLVTMLKRGGWWNASESALQQRQQKLDLTAEADQMTEQWFLSRIIARECSLCAGWTGNGLDISSPHRALAEVSQTDFADLASSYSDPPERHSSGLVFTTSVCGKLLLVAKETLIYVYELLGTALRPITSVVCPRRVLSMSMDVSSGRNAVAALLEGRMGMVCELRFGQPSGSESPVEVEVETNAHAYRTTTKASILTSRASEFRDGLDVSDRVLTTSHRPGPRRNWTNFSSVNVQANHDAVTLHGTDNHRTHDRNWINHAWNLDIRSSPTASNSTRQNDLSKACLGNIPIETGTSTFYRHLCSEDDPPRSVSICPQRRCVAFGCSAGIELHWIDALTGQSLSRWFPLTAPSDYLFFLPPRPGFESSKKLRLISSAAHPHDRPAIRSKFASSRPTVSSFWGSFGFDSNVGRPGASDCDHYHAVPLSDGHHVLFLEPLAGRLFLGCDAPLGGPTKLLRKILLMAPDENQVARLYTAAADLTWGARIVAVFGDSIYLYTVPPDIFNLSTLEQKAESWDVYTTAPFSIDSRTKDHCLEWLDTPCVQDTPDRNPIWPIALRGVEIGSMRGICEITVFTHPDITVWAFNLDAQSKTWQMRHQTEPPEQSRRYICRSGIVHNTYGMDSSGDGATSEIDCDHVCTTDDLDSEPERSVGFDGNSSQTLIRRIPKALAIENDEWVELLDVRGCDAWYNGNGDIIMTGDSPVLGGWDAVVSQGGASLNLCCAVADEMLASA